MAEDNENENRQQEKSQPWYIAHLIAGISAPPRVKYLLTLVQRHTHSRKGFAWAGQKELAREMNVSLRTAERAWSAATHLGVLNVSRVRTGKQPADQHNEYSLNIEQLKQLQRSPEHPPRMTVDTHEHPSPVTVDTDPKHPSNLTPNTRQFWQEHPSKRAGTPVSGDGIGFEVKQVVSTSGSEKAVKCAPVFDSSSSTSGNQTRNTSARKKIDAITGRNADALKRTAWHLEGAGSDGHAAIELAELIFGNPSLAMRDRIVKLVDQLRKRGFHIATVGEDSRKKRFVLKM